MDDRLLSTPAIALECAHNLTRDMAKIATGALKSSVDCLTSFDKAKALLATLGIDYDAISKEQFVNLIEVLKLSKHMDSPISQRGKVTLTHGKGKGQKR